jgi:hypothetical protein
MSYLWPDQRVVSNSSSFFSYKIQSIQTVNPFSSLFIDNPFPLSFFNDQRATTSESQGSESYTCVTARNDARRDTVQSRAHTPIKGNQSWLFFNNLQKDQFKHSDDFYKIVWFVKGKKIIFYDKISKYICDLFRFDINGVNIWFYPRWQ